MVGGGRVARVLGEGGGGGEGAGAVGAGVGLWGARVGGGVRGVLALEGGGGVGGEGAGGWGGGGALAGRAFGRGASVGGRVARVLGESGRVGEGFVAGRAAYRRVGGGVFGMLTERLLGFEGLAAEGAGWHCLLWRK